MCMPVCVIFCIAFYTTCKEALNINIFLQAEGDWAQQDCNKGVQQGHRSAGETDGPCLGPDIHAAAWPGMPLLMSIYFIHFICYWPHCVSLHKNNCMHCNISRPLTDVTQEILTSQSGRNGSDYIEKQRKPRVWSWFDHWIGPDDDECDDCRRGLVQPIIPELLSSTSPAPCPRRSRPFHTYTRMHTNMHTCVIMHTHTYACEYKYHLNMHTCTHTICIELRIQVRICIHVHIKI